MPVRVSMFRGLLGCLWVVVVALATSAQSAEPAATPDAAKPALPSPKAKPAKGPPALPEHPRLLLTAADIPVLKEKIEKQPWARTAFDRIKRQADEFTAKSVTLPERGGQWFHHYACKKDAGRLRTEGPTRHVCTICDTVYGGWPYDECVMSRQHDDLAKGLLHCGLCYRLTDEAHYAATAKEILLAYARRYLSYPLHTVENENKVGGGRVMAQTLDEAGWMISVAQGADLIWSTLTPEEKDLATRGLFLPCAEVIRSHKMKVHNIQCFKNSAVGLIGFLLGDMGLIADAINAPEYGYLTQMRQGVSPEGVWYEGSWGYHLFTMEAVWPLTEAAHHCGINLYGPEYKRMFEAAMLLAMPNLSLPMFNDTGETSIRNSHLYEVAMTRYGDEHFAAVVNTSQRNSLVALVLGKPEVPEKGQYQFPSRNFPIAGYGILRHGNDEDATWLALDYGPHGGGHGHPDKLGFVLYSGNQVIAPDPGSVSYAVPIHKEWYRTTIAHNTLTVDGQSQADATGAALGFIAADGMSGIIADAGPIARGLRFRRAVGMFGGDVILFVDRVASVAPRVLDFAYHNRGAFAEKPTGAAVTLPKAPGYMHLDDAVVAASGGTYSVGFKLDGIVATRFTALLPAGAQVLTASGVGKNKTDRVPTVIVRAMAGELLLGWAVTIGDNEAATPQLKFRSDLPNALEATLGERKCVLVANPEMRRGRLENKTLTSTLAMMHKVDGKVTVEQAKMGRK